MLETKSQAEHERFCLAVERLREMLEEGGEEVDALDPDRLAEMRYFAWHQEEVYAEVCADRDDSEDRAFPDGIDHEKVDRAIRRCMARGQVGPVEVLP